MGNIVWFNVVHGPASAWLAVAGTALTAAAGLGVVTGAKLASTHPHSRIVTGSKKAGRKLRKLVNG